MEYSEYLKNKVHDSNNYGFDPVFMPDFLFDFQKHLIEWSTRKGRGAIFADCGLGKSPMELVWAQNIVEKTNGKVLLLTPLAVGAQMEREAVKFGIDATRQKGGLHQIVNKKSSKIVITNYEQLHHFNPSDFDGVICD